MQPQLNRQQSQIQDNYLKVKIDFPFENNLKQSRKRTDIEIEQGNIFKIDNFLDKSELQYLIKTTEEKKYQSVSSEYTQDYRCCDRILALSQKLADVLWNRLLPHLQVDDLDNIKPFGIGTEGVWIVTGINPCFRFCKYDKGGHFSKHRDGGFVYNDDKRSIYTLMVYLNDDFTGGNTIFYENNGKNTYQIKPKAGTVVIFNHDIEHQGDAIIQGQKYIFRTDIMFERVKSLNQTNFENLQEYKEAEKLYQLSIQYQKEGNVQKSTEAFLKAEEINFKYSNSLTLQKKNSFKNQENSAKLSSNVLSMIFSYLVTGKNVTKQMIQKFVQLNLVCKFWKTVISTNNYLWREIYISKWTQDQMQNDNVSILPPDSRWYILFQQRWLQEYFRIFIMDVGFDLTYFGMNGFESRKKPMYVFHRLGYEDEELIQKYKFQYTKEPNYILSQVASYKGHSHALRQGFQEHFVGFQVQKEYEQFNSLFEYKDLNKVYKPWTNKQQLNSKIPIILGGWILNEAFNKRLYPEEHPIFISLPYFTTQNEKNQIIEESQKLIKIPQICFMERELLALYSQNLESATVLILDSYISTIITIHNKELQTKSGLIIHIDNLKKNLKEVVKKINQQFILQKVFKSQEEQTLLIVSNFQEIPKEQIEKLIISNIKKYKKVIIENQDCIIKGGLQFCSLPDIKKHFQILQSKIKLKLPYYKGYGYDYEEYDYYYNQNNEFFDDQEDNAENAEEQNDENTEEQNDENEENCSNDDEQEENKQN